MLDKIHFVCPSSIQHRESSIAFSRRPSDAAPFARFWEKPTHPTPVIYPVILPVPPEVRELPPRERVRALSRRAREALALSAERLGVALGPLEKDARGAPLPCAGWFWSLTHKPLYVGGVLAPHPVGVDLEQLRPGLARALPQNGRPGRVGPGRRRRPAHRVFSFLDRQGSRSQNRRRGHQGSLPLPGHADRNRRPAAGGLCRPGVER